MKLRLIVPILTLCLMSGLSGCASGSTATGESSPSNEEESSPSQNGISIIGGADGPTSIFLAGKLDMTDLDSALSSYIRQYAPISSFSPLRLEHHRVLMEYSGSSFDETICYIYSLQTAWDLDENQKLQTEPSQVFEQLVVATLTPDEEGQWQLGDFWTSGDFDSLDEADFKEQIESHFPERLWEEAVEGPSLYRDDYKDYLLEEAAQEAEEMRKLFDFENMEPEDLPFMAEPGSEVIAPTTRSSDQLAPPLPLELGE